MEAAIFVITALICRWLGWRTPADYSTGLMWAGFAIMIFGLFSLLGGTSLNTDFKHQYSQSVMPNSAGDRAQQNVADTAAGMSFASWTGLAGIVTIVLGYILGTLLS